MEKQGYRENIEFLKGIFGDRACISKAEAAEALGVSVDAIEKAMKRVNNPFPYQKVGRRVVIPVPGMARWMCG